MPAGLKSATKTFLLATAAAAVVVGCDSDQGKADKQVKQDLWRARQIAASAQDGSTDAAKSALDQAAGNANASPGMRALAKAALAQAELDSAYQTMRKLEHQELILSRLVWETSQLAEQMRTSGSTIVGYQKYDPKAARDAIAAKIAEAQGGPGKSNWFQNGKASIPTLSAVKQEISRLEGEISQRQDQIKSITDERTKLLDQAEQAAAQADQLKGDKAVEVFKRSSDLRKQAGDKSVQITKLNSELTRLQRDLAIAQGQQSILNDVIKQLQDQAAALEAGWKQIDAQVSKQQQVAAQILGTAEKVPPAGAGEQGAPATPGLDPVIMASAGQSIAQKAQYMHQVLQEIKKLRDVAQEDGSNAATHFEQAYRAADELRMNMERKISDPNNAQRPERSAWQTAQQVMEPNQYRLRQAAAQRTLGELYASEATSAQRCIDLRDLMNAATSGTNLTVPPAIAEGDLNKDRQVALDLADEALKKSDEILSDVIDGRAEELKGTAQLSRALTQYDWAQVARQAGKTDAANEHIQAAIQARNSAAERNVPIPPMPAELGAPPKPAGETSEEAPSTQPTTAPAQTEAPAAEPAATPPAPGQ